MSNLQREQGLENDDHTLIVPLEDAPERACTEGTFAEWFSQSQLDGPQTGRRKEDPKVSNGARAQTAYGKTGFVADNLGSLMGGMSLFAAVFAGVRSYENSLGSNYTDADFSVAGFVTAICGLILCESAVAKSRGTKGGRGSLYSMLALLGWIVVAVLANR